MARGLRRGYHWREDAVQRFRVALGTCSLEVDDDATRVPRGRGTRPRVERGAPNRDQSATVMAIYNLQEFTVLVVEDNAYIRHLLYTALKTLSVGEVVTAKHGGEAIEELKETKPGEVVINERVEGDGGSVGHELTRALDQAIEKYSKV